jgi:hypothetical protein
MGNSTSTSSVTPTSLMHCINASGEVDTDEYLLYRRAKRLKRVSQKEVIVQSCVDLANEEIKQNPPTRKRSCLRRSLLLYRNEAGDLKEVTPRMTAWYIMYVDAPDLESAKFRKKFRRRFRCKHDGFLQITSLVKDSGLFDRWQGTDCTGKEASPIELLILGSLRYLGRGWTFDDLEESTSISEETHRQFFHVFIHFGSTYLFTTYVSVPATVAEAETHMNEMTEAGLHGAVGSMDATHIGMERCITSRSNMHMGPKLKMPSRTYNITASHRRRILSTTSGHPARWNDKTLMLFDSFISGLHDGGILSDVSFVLQERDEEGKIVEVSYKGAWLIVDNGYLHWSCAVPPFKDSVFYQQIRWSEWVESMRKDVECTFGIMKGRFRVLKTGVRLHSIEATDKIWLTCCALHNFLLEADGLDEQWEFGVPSDWEGELGEHNSSDVSAHLPNFALERLRTPGERRAYDTSGLGPGNDRDTAATDNQSNDDTVSEDHIAGSEGVRHVPNLSFEYFRGRLVEHFDILFIQNKIKWPSRLGPKKD